MAEGFPVEGTQTERGGRSFYIASCVFTTKYPELSKTIQRYIHDRYRMPIVRCCVPKYDLQRFREQMPEDYRDNWDSIPDCADFRPGDTVYSLCHNCSAILEESKPGVNIKSIWELILSDEGFAYPDYHGQTVTVQDCWRAKDRVEEQDAVRALLRKMGLDVRELPENRMDTDFCGVSVYRPSPQRNLELAPRRFVENAAGKFLPHTKEAQAALMRDYCKRFTTEKVVAYCHYCVEGLALGGADVKHLASLLFE